MRTKNEIQDNHMSFLRFTYDATTLPIMGITVLQCTVYTVVVRRSNFIRIHDSTVLIIIIMLHRRTPLENWTVKYN